MRLRSRKKPPKRIDLSKRNVAPTVEKISTCTVSTSTTSGNNQFQGRIDKTNGGRTANIEGNSHEPRSDGDRGDNDSSLPDGNAADAVAITASDSRPGSRTRGTHMRRTISAEAKMKARYAKNWSRERVSGQPKMTLPSGSKNARIQTSTIPANGGAGSVGVPVSTA